MLLCIVYKEQHPAVRTKRSLACRMPGQRQAMLSPGFGGLWMKICIGKRLDHLFSLTGHNDSPVTSHLLQHQLIYVCPKRCVSSRYCSFFLLQGGSTSYSDELWTAVDYFPNTSWCKVYDCVQGDFQAIDAITHSCWQL